MSIALKDLITSSSSLIVLESILQLKGTSAFAFQQTSSLSEDTETEVLSFNSDTIGLF